MAKESTGGKILMLCLPLVLAPSLAVSVKTMPLWLSVLGLATIALAEVGAICFFFPEATVHRWYHWRAYRAALASGRLRTEDVNRLLMSRHGRSASHQVQHHLLALIPAKARQDPAYGRISRDWIRRRDDLSLLDDALTANLSPEVLHAHLRGTKPLYPAAVATLAALLRDTNTGDGTDGPFRMMSMSHQ
jgi:hypothetical protein